MFVEFEYWWERYSENSVKFFRNIHINPNYVVAVEEIGELPDYDNKENSVFISCIVLACNDGNNTLSFTVKGTPEEVIKKLLTTQTKRGFRAELNVVDDAFDPDVLPKNQEE